MHASGRVALLTTSLAVVAVSLPAFSLPAVAQGTDGALPTGAPAGALPLDCAWGAEVSPTASNVYYPDSGATYWATPYVIDPDATVEVEGTYPGARYASLVTYQSSGGYFTSEQGTDSWLADHEIAPDKGSKNPFTKRGSHAGPGGSYSVEVTQDAGPHEQNVLPMAADATTEGEVGYLVYRVYVPQGGDVSAVELPEITVHDESGSTTLPECAERTEITDVPDDPYGPTDDHAFAAQPVGGLFPNPHNYYVTMDMQLPGEDEVTVVRGRAPVQSGGDEPVTWPNREDQVRYWSMCSALVTNPALLTCGGGSERHDLSA